MLKKNLLLAALASMLAFSVGCKKDEEKKGDEAAKPAEKAEKPAEKAEDKPAEKAEEKKPEAAAGGDYANLSKEELADKAIEMFTAMADAVKAGGEDCDKIGASLDKIITDGKPLMDAGKKFDEDPEAKKWFDETHGKKVEELMTGMMGGLMQCMENEAVKAAMAKME